MEIKEAQSILDEFVESESLQRHCKSVACSMRHFAPEGEKDMWYVVGLLHDFDYEKWPETHPDKGQDILRERSLDEESVIAILKHDDRKGPVRETAMEKTLFAVDELSGFVVAVSQVRPDKMIGMKVKSVKKKMKAKSFAAAVNRDDFLKGAGELGIELEELIQGVIDALTESADELGLS
ncbi:HAD family hydrolase [Candidatus Gracilibacteria bacterium]|nr:HAD family hydrolase [Candidatus Gracilibacteria bacterium]